jgi:hypothetical protein
MGLRRRAAAFVAAAMVMSGAALAASGPAQAAQVTLKCKVLSTTLTWNKGTPPGSDGDFTLTAKPASPAGGAKVTLTLDAPKYINGPIPRPAGSMTPRATVKWSGGTVKLAGKAQGQLSTDTEFVVNPMTGTMTAPKSGKVDFTLTNVTFDDNPVDIVCTPTSAVVVGSFTIAGGSSTSGTAKNTGSGSTTTQGTTTGGSASTGTSPDTAETGTLPKTGPEDWWKSALVALALFQMGMIVWARTRRNPDFVARHVAR